MGLLEPYIPPSREKWELLTYLWQFYPIVSKIGYLAKQNITADASPDRFFPIRH